MGCVCNTSQRAALATSRPRVLFEDEQFFLLELGLRVLFEGEYYSSAETIHGNTETDAIKGGWAHKSGAEFRAITSSCYPL